MGLYSPGSAGVVRALIAAGADVNHRQPSGDTPLSLATQRRHAEVMDILRKAGAK